MFGHTWKFISKRVTTGKHHNIFYFGKYLNGTARSVFFFFFFLMENYVNHGLNRQTFTSNWAVCWDIQPIWKVKNEKYLTLYDTTTYSFPNRQVSHRRRCRVLGTWRKRVQWTSGPPARYHPPIFRMLYMAVSPQGPQELLLPREFACYLRKYRQGKLNCHFFGLSSIL